jgi:hypothetical protein
MMGSLIAHIEGLLGHIDSGWSTGSGSTQIQVAKFVDQPFRCATTYVTLGLSDHVFSMPRAREVRQEFVFTAYDRFPGEQIASFMLTFCERLIVMKQALLRGDVVGPSDPIIPGVAVNAVYATVPVVFDDAFHTYSGSSPPTVMVWLLPLLSSEAGFVKRNGWSQFEDILETEDPDLWDLNRKSIIR